MQRLKSMMGLALLLAAPAMAQTAAPDIVGTPPIGTTAKETPYQSYRSQQVVAGTTCTSTTCTIPFATVPTGKRLIVQYIAVNYTLNAPSTSTGAFLTATLGAAVTMPLPTQSLGGVRYVASTPITAHVDQTRQPQIYVYGPGINGYVVGVVVGTLVDK